MRRKLDKAKSRAVSIKNHSENMKSLNFRVLYNLSKPGKGLANISQPIITRNTHIHFSINDVYKTAQNYDEIEHIPCITKVILWNRREKNGHQYTSVHRVKRELVLSLLTQEILLKVISQLKICSTCCQKGLLKLHK